LHDKNNQFMLSQLLETEDALVSNEHKQSFLQFLSAKDDNLLLQTTGLLLAICSNSLVN
jgi:hypothetical protein